MMEIRYGYTLTELHEIVRLAVHTVGPMGMDWHERYDVAHSAVAEFLYSAEQPPRRADLVRAGQLAIYQVVSDYRRHHGFYKAKTIGGAAGPGSSPNFAKFWGAREVPWEDRMIERITVSQIFATLTARQQEALLALAVLENYRAASDHLGIKPQTFRALLGRARTEFFALWHEGEKPSRPWGTDRRVARYEEDRR